MPTKRNATWAFFIKQIVFYFFNKLKTNALRVIFNFKFLIETYPSVNFMI